MEQFPGNHPLDKLISDQSLFLLEALVPFIDYPYKKMLVLFIKYRELMSIMNSLNDRDFISSCGFDCHPKNTEEMLINMCDFLPGNITSSMKQMKQMMSMMEMMNSMPQNTSNTTNDSFSFNNNTNREHSGDLFESVLSILENEKTET